MFYQTQTRTQAAERAEKCHFLSLVTLTFDLDIQTRPSEGPKDHFPVNVQQFPRYFIHKQKSHREQQNKT